MKNRRAMLFLAAIFVIGILITKGTYRFVEKSAVVTEESSDEAVPEMAAAVEVPEGGAEGEAAPMALAAAVDTDMEAAGKTEEETEAAQPGRSLSSGRSEGEGESISPLDTAAAVEMEAYSAGDTGAKESVSYYKKRLNDLDSQIQKNKTAQDSVNINNSAKSAASNELKLWDGELNTIYNEILDRLDKDRSASLVEEQRAWMKERDGLAMEAAKNSAGGSAESVEYIVSQIESTRQRAYDLVECYEALLTD